MDCFQYEELLSAMLDGEISWEEKEQLEEHLRQCPECRALLEDLKLLQNEMAFLAADPPEDLSGRILEQIQAGIPASPIIFRRKFRVWLAAAAVLAIALIGFTINRLPPPASQETLSASDSFSAENSSPQNTESDIANETETAGNTPQEASAKTESEVPVKPAQASMNHEPADKAKVSPKASPSTESKLLVRNSQNTSRSIPAPPPPEEAMEDDSPETIEESKSIEYKRAQGLTALPEQSSFTQAETSAFLKAALPYDNAILNLECLGMTKDETGYLFRVDIKDNTSFYYIVSISDGTVLQMYF